MVLLVYYSFVHSKAEAGVIFTGLASRALRFLLLPLPFHPGTILFDRLARLQLTPFSPT